MKTPSNNMIAFVFGILGLIFSSVIFFWSRNDPNLRIAALVAATGTVSAVVAICSTLLTGKDLTNREQPSVQIPLVPPTSTTVKVDPTSSQETTK